MSHHHSLPALQAIDIVSRYRHIRPLPQQPDFAAHSEGADLNRPLTPELKPEPYQALQHGSCHADAVTARSTHTARRSP